MMTSENFFAANSASNLSDVEKSSNTSKSQEIGKEKMKLKELFNRDLNKNIYKLCSKADLRLKVLLSNTVSEITSFTKSEDPKGTFSGNDTPNKFSSLGSTSKLHSPRPSTSKCSTRRTLKQRRNNAKNDISGSFHFNTEIDNIDDPINQQLTVVKILRLTDLARRIEERQSSLIKNQFESAASKKSYVNGLEEGYRYGYLDNTIDEPKTKSEMIEKTSDSTLNDNDKVILKNNEIIDPEKKESTRMRGGYQDPQQTESRLINKFNSERSIPAEKIKSDILAKPVQAEQLEVTIKPEFPSECTEEVNIQAFNDKYRTTNVDEKTSKSKHAHELDLPTKDLSAVGRGQQYLQYFEKMLNSLGEEFAQGFRAGFGDGFSAANIYISIDTTFSEDEKDYITQMRKCLKFYEDDIDNDIKKINARAEEMKKMLNIPNDEFEEISYLIRKGVAKIPLKFSKNDHKFYMYATNQDRQNKKNKSIYEDESVIHASFEEVKDIIPQHSKNRAIRYLKKHKINEFFRFLGSHLVANKPEDPISFLINLLEKCIDYRFNELNVSPPLLFTNKHVESVYSVLDPMLTGYIDIQQYVHGMEALGIRNLDDLENFRSGEKIDKYIFITNAGRRLLGKFREIIAMDTVIAIPPTATYTTVEAK